MPHSLYATDTDLTADNLLRLPAEFGCPVWVYDAQIIRRQIAQLSQFDVVRFAQKACSNIHILRLMREQGVKRVVFASSAAVYGQNGEGTAIDEDTPKSPLTPYASDKLASEYYLDFYRRQHGLEPAIFRFFNVYGPREEHKGRMASVAYHCYQQLRRDGRVELFGEHGGFPPGGHLRDFVAVEDVARVNLHFFDHPQRSGIFNLGSGQARTFNEVALAVINSVRANADQPPLSLQQAVESGLLGYREFPESLRARYQSHTCADLELLREAGYRDDFQSLEEGVAGYCRWLARSA